jgi:TetR/AcrR family transcriptional regulator, lmrAB and yxaGH operons repressor
LPLTPHERTVRSAALLRFVARRKAKAMEAVGPLGAIDASEQAWRAVFTETEFSAGCPIAAATVDGEQIPAAREAAGEVFGDWQDALATSQRSQGVRADRAAAITAIVRSALAEAGDTSAGS